MAKEENTPTLTQEALEALAEALTYDGWMQGLREARDAGAQLTSTQRMLLRAYELRVAQGKT